MNGFNSDIYIKEEVMKLRDKFNIKNCIETGTHTGNTTEVLGEIFDKVKTIEINVNYYQASVKRLSSKTNIECIKGSSPIKLNQLLNYVTQPVFFYLDAHWGNYNPLIDELKVLAKHNMKNSIIVIHDFKVPRKDFGFDKFPNGKLYEWKEIANHVKAIYGEDGFEYYYNEKVSGANRGVIFIHQKQVGKNEEIKI